MVSAATVPTPTPATEQATKPGGTRSPALLRPPAPLKASQVPIIRLAASLGDSLSRITEAALRSRADVSSAGAVAPYSFKTRRTLVPAAARQPPDRTWIELSATIDFMQVGNEGA